MRGPGYDLWLKYRPLTAAAAAPWFPWLGSVSCEQSTAILESAAGELSRALPLLFAELGEVTDLVALAAASSDRAGSGPEASVAASGRIVAGRPAFVYAKTGKDFSAELPGSPEGSDSASDGFAIRTVSAGNGQAPALVVCSRTDRGVLYGVFALLRAISQGSLPDNVAMTDTPRLAFRMLDHWDNPDGSIERGYAGNSLWKWEELPSRVDSRYADYARASASVGINAAALNNVNAACSILSPEYVAKVAAIADVLRVWGIKTFLSINFASPMRLGGLPTADPQNPAVIGWWRDKASEIYARIPDFGGFLVKADSEGQPGPFAYGRSHADGANMLARALAPFGGIVIWRAFVYGHGENDRAKKAWANFMPHDGEFEHNVAVQVKNGAIDFQPREPVHPLFGSMEKTPLFMEFQVTQEYLGQGNHLVYLGPMWKEILDFDTYARGEGSTVARLLEAGGAASALDAPGPAPLSGIAGVSNIGDNDDWCGSLFHPLNWYAFGRLCWNPGLDADAIAREWIAQTWGADPSLVADILAIVSPSWEACVDYMTPLCLHHIMKEGHHYGPDPAFDGGPREDWRSTYYHRADSVGIGFDRTRAGTAGVDQYRKPVADTFDDIDRCPEKYLLWFHHAPWTRRLSSGRTLAEEIPARYARGVEAVRRMRERWLSLAPKIDPELHAAVLAKLDIQLADAKEWEAVCVPYFASFSRETAKSNS